MTPTERVKLLWAGLDKPERWTGLAEIERFLHDALFYKTFVAVWSNNETNDRFLPVIDRMIDQRGVMVQRVMPHLKTADRKFLDGLPDPIPVFRGTTLENPYCDYSWTTDFKKAEWFAHRSSEATPAMASGMVAKADVLFADVGRNESEIAVRTDRVADKIITQVGPWHENPAHKLYAAVQAGDIFGPLDKELLMLRVRSAQLFGMTKAATIAEFHRHADELERAGLVTAARVRRKAYRCFDDKPTRRSGASGTRPTA